jgi:hypothetical protein
MDTLPPPPQIFSTDDIPDYYCGCLIAYDDLSDDNCRWIVYDGVSKVRCPNRAAAINYINEHISKLSGRNIKDYILDARISLNHAIRALDKAGDNTHGVEQLMLRKLAVSLRPTLVEIDNIVLD